MTLDYLTLTGRRAEQVELVEAYAKAQGLFREAGTEALYDETIELDLSLVEPSLAGPKRPQDRVSLTKAKTGFQAALPSMMTEKKSRSGRPASSSAVAVARSAARNRRGPRARRGRRGSHHELHEHVEPERDDRRGPSGEKGRRARPQPPAVGQDEPGAWIEGGDRLPGEGRTDVLPRRARLQPGRLWVHDVHRQQRSAAGRRVVDRRREQSRRLFGAERQQKLRGTHSIAGACQLPGVAAAGRRIRNRRPDDAGPDDRAARKGSRREGRVSFARSGRRSARFRPRC